MQTVACIVQARLGSSRLPAKVLLPLPTGRTVIEEVLHRCKQIPGVDVVVAAIPRKEEDRDARRRKRDLTAAVERAGVLLVEGQEYDVLARYVKAAKQVSATTVMRITADCPLLDPSVSGWVLDCHRCWTGELAYTSNCYPNRTYPQGLDTEVFSTATLMEAHRRLLPFPRGRNRPGGLIQMHREHVTPWMHWSGINTSCVTAAENRSHLRWTLDTPEDYEVIKAVMEQQMREAA
jgi:spore coat polysaccharide biosynthesis protein SpsF